MHPLSYVWQCTCLRTCSFNITHVFVCYAMCTRCAMCTCPADCGVLPTCQSLSDGALLCPCTCWCTCPADCDFIQRTPCRAYLRSSCVSRHHKQCLSRQQPTHCEWSIPHINACHLTAVHWCNSDMMCSWYAHLCASVCVCVCERVQGCKGGFGIVRMPMLGPPSSPAPVLPVRVSATNSTFQVRVCVCVCTHSMQCLHVYCAEARVRSPCLPGSLQQASCVTCGTSQHVVCFLVFAKAVWPVMMHRCTDANIMFGTLDLDDVSFPHAIAGCATATMSTADRTQQSHTTKLSESAYT